MDIELFKRSRIIKQKGSRYILSSRYKNLCDKLGFTDKIVESTSYLSDDSSFSCRIYHVINGPIIPKCSNPSCNSNVKFRDFSSGYTKFCSRSCQGSVKMTEYNYDDKYKDSRISRNKRNSEFMRSNINSEEFINGRRLGGVNSMKKLDPHNNHHESVVKNLLESLSIEFSSNRRVYVSKSTYYKPDFIIDDAKLIIELDGSIHRHESRKIVDNDKDSKMNSLGFIVERIDVSSITDDQLRSLINKLLEKYLCKS